MTPPPGPTYDEGFGHEPMSALEDLAALCLATGALLIAAAGVKVAVDSRAHFLTGESLAARGDRRHTPADEVAAAEAYARAVRSYVPFFSHGPEALARIRTVGETLAKDGHRDSARRVWLTGAAAAASVALIYAPYDEEATSLLLAAGAPGRAEAARK